jgi:hypothetical protein
MPTVEQEHTTVPFRYRARLAWAEKVPTRPEPEGRRRQFGDKEWTATATADHSLVISGWLHPREYTHAAATALAQEKLDPFMVMGWTIESLVVSGYHAKDV